jgi:long-chain acyl-CoA synthetase
LTDVGQTFQQNELLIAGGNGFLGKVLLAMLLDRYPQVKHIHILMRAGRSASAQDRFSADVLGSPVLAPLVKKLGEQFLRDKITVWTGDVGVPNCGLDPAALDQLTGRVGAIINCAGLVDFFPPVDESFRSNVDGVEHTVAVAKHLGAKLVHISTCYVCGGADGLVEETEPILGFYPHRKGRDDESFRHKEELFYSRERIRQIYDSSGSNGSSGSTATTRSRELQQRLIGLGRQRAENWGWVNTYTYAKSLGEQIIASEQDLNYSIVRPAIVESALRFPFPGWIEGGRTAAPLVLMALGGLREWPIRRDIPLEVVPVDLVAAAILTVTALLLDGQSERVYQLGSADVNPTILESIVKLLVKESRKLQKERQDSSRGPSFIHRLVGAGPNKRLRFLTVEEARVSRVRLQDKIQRAQSFLGSLSKTLEKTGMPGKLTLAQWTTALRTLSLQSTFREQTLDQYLPFVQDHRYIFESGNIRTAHTLITEKDRALLPWDPENINWDDYWINHQVAGTEKWIQPEAVKDWAFKI